MHGATVVAPQAQERLERVEAEADAKLRQAEQRYADTQAAAEVAASAAAAAVAQAQSAEQAA
eukprot:COSAG01_NODE_15471_length_1333_cov_1.919773_1_plen_61_part_01